MWSLIETHFLFLTIFSFSKASVKWRPDMKSFTHSVKQGGCKANKEIYLFEYTKGPGVITEQWFTGKGCIDETTIVRYYIDGDESPSIEVNLYLAHGIGFPNKEQARKSDRSSTNAKHKGTSTNEASMMTFRKKDHLEKKEMDSMINDWQARTAEDETALLIKEFMRIKNQTNKSRDENPSRKTQINPREENSEDQTRNPLRNLLLDKNWGIDAKNESTESMSSDDNLVPNDDIDVQADSRTEPSGIDSDPGIPWGTLRMGHLANNGALYNTIRIPFQKSIYVSLTSTRHGHYWYNVRGMQNYPVIIGDLELPQNTRLRVYKQENITVQPFEYIFLASTFNKSGLLYLVTLSTESKNFYHQEACFRAIIDYDNDIHYLSSGTEDLFLSAYYYSGGIYHTDHSGLSYKDDPGRVTAYKFFEEDPMLFNEAFSLVWRCGELADNKCLKIFQKNCNKKYNNDKCVTEDDYEAMNGFNESNMKHTKPATIYSYIWIYEW